MTAPPAKDSRLARRRAERRAERRARRQYVRLALFGVTVAGLVTALVLLLVDGTGSGAAPAKAAHRTGSTVDAELGDADLANAYIAAATSELGAVTSYDYRHLDDALSAGLGVTTGAYRTAFQHALTGDVAAAARRNHTVQTFDLVKAGIGYMAADGSTGVVLAFGSETVIQDANTTTTPLTLTATLQRQGSSYLISKLEIGTNPGLPPGTQAMLTAAEAAREGVLAELTSQPGVQGSVAAIAVEHADGDSVTLLVAGTATRPDSTGRPAVVTDGRYEVVVTRTNGGWRPAGVTPIGSA